MTSSVLAGFQQNEIQRIKLDKGLDFLWCHHFLLGIFLPSLLCFFQWSNCWQESQGLMQPSYFVHEHCLQRYRFPRSALFSKAEGTHCQNSKIHFIRSQPLDAVVFNLSQKIWEYIYIYMCF